MIAEHRCPNCNTSYEVMWEDNEEAFYSSVEDTDTDYDDYDKESYPQYCPFCGAHNSYDGAL